MRKNLTLTGMMGVGKSTIGKAVSKRLSMEFIDIDKIIEKKLKLSVQKIFERKGEVFFRSFEENVTLEELKKKNKTKKKSFHLLVFTRLEKSQLITHVKCIKKFII